MKNRQLISEVWAGNRMGLGKFRGTPIDLVPSHCRGMVAAWRRHWVMWRCSKMLRDSAGPMLPK